MTDTHQFDYSILTLLKTKIKNYKLGKQNGRIIIGIAGPPGSGKTSISEVLAKECAIKVIPMDGFHFSKKYLKSMDDPQRAFDRRGSPFTFDTESLIQKLLRVKKGEDVNFPSFDHAKGDPIEDDIKVTEKEKIIIVEGLYLFIGSVQQDDREEREKHEHSLEDILPIEPKKIDELPEIQITQDNTERWKPLLDVFDEKWYIDVPLKECRTRLVKRHMNAWHCSKEEALKRINQNDLPNGKLVVASRKEAEVIINNC
mmetsp:Transcript_2707/g.3890  ORF Transcript_2707/g.3890 Transcript_2707/m.3890 type:complete len:257 (+) Transcript_2707:66-836(+)